ncbi:MAG: hypothetical protein Q8O25_03310 [Sulfurisoma sp.]|nr:hypothetical protein [Sulfurisoma sp.]
MTAGDSGHEMRRADALLPRLVCAGLGMLLWRIPSRDAPRRPGVPPAI